MAPVLVGLWNVQALGGLLAGVAEYGDDRADLDRVAGSGPELQHGTGIRHRDFDHGFLGLDLAEIVRGRHVLADFHEPVDDLAFLQAGTEVGQTEFLRHDQSSITVRTANAVLFKS